MRNTIAFSLLILAFACSHEEKPKLTEEEKTTIVMDVKEVLNNYNADVKAGGLTAEFKYLDNSKDFQWTPPGYQEPISYDSCVSMMKNAAGTYKEIDNSFESLTIDALAADTAFYSGKVKSTVTDTAGTAVTVYMNEKGKLIKRKDGWKLLTGETSISLSGK